MTTNEQPRYNVKAVLVEAEGSSSAARAFLERSVTTLATATTVEGARYLLATSAPDLVVIDLDVDREAVLKLLLAEALPRIPAWVVMSRAAQAADAFRLGQAGVRSFVIEPANEVAIGDAVRCALEEAPDFTPHVRAAVGFLPIHEIERLSRKTMMQEALARAGGSKTGAAKLLQISRQLLQHMIRGQKRMCF